MRARRLKNLHQEAAQFRRRAFIALVGVVLGLGGLAAWYFHLQVVRHDEFATRSEQNRVKLRPVVPGRGLIYDRKGRVLADNVPAWRLEVTLGEAGGPARGPPARAQAAGPTPARTG